MMELIEENSSEYDRTYYESASKRVTILDTPCNPGEKDLILALSQADVAVLLVTD